jgi:hypothetical protein
VSKAWDLSCTCRKQEYEACPYCLLHIQDGAKKKMSADWLHDDTQTTSAIPLPVDDAGGYHVNKIPKGSYGQSTKIMEEVLELQDAEAQNAKIMALHELSDIIGAVHGYLREHYPDMKFEDLLTMSEITQR